MKKAENSTKVLVTGAGGFIGSHLTEALIEKGYEVVGLLEPEDHNPWIKNINAQFIRGDVTIKNSLYKAVKGVSCIYHLAAYKTGPSIDRYYITNYLGTRNMVNVCLESGAKIKRFLFTSSIAAIGPGEKGKLLDESTPCKPISAYGRSKLFAEQFLTSVGKKLPVTIVRLPIVYGPRFSGFLLPIFKLLNRGFRVSSGHPAANLVFVKDIAEGIIMTAESPEAAGKVYHLGGEKNYSMDEVLTCIEQSLGRKTIKLRLPYLFCLLVACFSEYLSRVKITELMIRRQNIEEYLKYSGWGIDISKAERELGYKAQTRLEEGMRVTLGWYRKEGLI
ncbi:MAG: NAD-dependent epimerase/dehydratase family protein [Candidatus Hydrothermarchaeota archaeon]